MARFNGIRYHFEGVREKTTQIRELVEVLDTMFDSFHRVNKISKNMLGQPRMKQRPPKY